MTTTPQAAPTAALPPLAASTPGLRKQVVRMVLRTGFGRSPERMEIGRAELLVTAGLVTLLLVWALLAGGSSAPADRDTRPSCGPVCPAAADGSQPQILALTGGAW